MQQQHEALGSWVATLEPWTHMVTFTHDPARLERRSGHTRVGPQRHIRLMRDWWDYVTDRDPHAALWHEAEFHESGQVHGHALAKFAPMSPVLSFRQAWYDLAGFCLIEPVESAAQAGAYITKRCGIYVTKHPTIEPLVRGVAVRTAFGRMGDR